MVNRLLRYSLFFVVCFLPFNVLAQLHGVIRNAYDNTPIANVNITISNQHVGTSSSSHGTFRLPVKAFPVQVVFSAIGFKTHTETFTQTDSNLVIYLEPSTLDIEEIVVAATRWWQRSSHVPTKITSITTSQITLHSPQTSADLLGTSGQVFIQKSQLGGGSPMIRGFATNRLLYAVDGIRMNTAIFRGGNIQNVINIDPFSVEKTEVAFGPGSVIYGSDAIGGVMSFQTLTPKTSETDSILVSGKIVGRVTTADNERTGHIDLNLGWKKFASVSSFSYWNFDDLRQGSHGPEDYIKDYYVVRENGTDLVVTQNDKLLQIPTAYSQFNLLQKFRYLPNAHWDIEYAFSFSETSSYGRYDRHNRVRNGTARYAEWDYGPQLWIMNKLQVAHTNPTRFYDQAISRIAYQKFEESRIDRALNSDLRSIREEFVDAYSANIDFTKALGKHHTLFYGAEYVFDDVTSVGTDENIASGAKTPGPSRYPQANWQSIGFYVSNELTFSDKLTGQAGLRYNQFIIDSEFDTTFYPFPFTEAHLNNASVTGSIGAVYQLDPTFRINANLGTAFRAPNVDDIGKVFDSEPGAVVVPNPDLKAEYAYNAELGVAKVFDDMLKVELIGYYTILDNALVRRSYTLNGSTTMLYEGVESQIQAMQNAAVARVYGLQTSLNIAFSHHINLSTDLNLQKGEEEMDDGTISPSRHAAPFFGTSRLSYTTGDLQLLLYVDFQGERSYDELAIEEREKDEIYAKDELGRNYAPGWATINLKTFYEISDRVSLSAGLENIADVRYRPYSSGISGPGRNLFVSLRTTI